jgi:hypothetical protein
MSDNDSRYDAIIRNIAQRKRDEANAPQQDTLATLLDHVNAWGFLEDLKKSRRKPFNCYGPKTFRSYLPASWVGVVVWCKPKGYYHYETLTLLGVWAYEADGATYITLGTKTLPFNAPVFNPESYYHHLKRRFDLYYEDDGSPPPESARLYTANYDSSKRLEIREAIQREIVAWAKAYR